MALQRLYVIALIALFGVSCFASPLFQPGTDGKTEPALRARRDVLGKALTRRENSVQSRDARMERMITLPDDQREFMNRQIMQALAEIISRDECFLDRDYKGWVDFGKRSSD
ncbi:gastrin/cholecystokinin-like peptide [Alosa alosa]|nr:gastrin/cholecystokinin-like peptide [Alosa alosa]